jgi:hypothetical protein
MIPVLFPMISIRVQMKRLFFRVSKILIPNDAPIIFEKLKNTILARLPEKVYSIYNDGKYFDLQYFNDVNVGLQNGVNVYIFRKMFTLLIFSKLQIRCKLP